MSQNHGLIVGKRRGGAGFRFGETSQEGGKETNECNTVYGIVAWHLETRLVDGAGESVFFLDRRNAMNGFIEAEDITERDAGIHHVEQRNF